MRLFISRVVYFVPFKMDYRPIKVKVSSFLTAAGKGRLVCARARRKFVLSAAMASSSPSPKYEFETESDADSNATLVPDCEYPEGWGAPAHKRKLEANKELAMDPKQFNPTKI